MLALCQEPSFALLIHSFNKSLCQLSCSKVLGFPGGSTGKESAYNVGDLGLIPGLGRSPGEGKGYPLQYSGLENSLDCIAQGVAKSWTRLSDFHFQPWVRDETTAGEKGSNLPKIIQLESRGAGK